MLSCFNGCAVAGAAWPTTLAARRRVTRLPDCLRQGVGSHAAHMLLRSGVGRLRLIDFDQVTLSSLNRHATATRQDVGLPKATCLQVPSTPCEAFYQVARLFPMLGHTTERVLQAALASMLSAPKGVCVHLGQSAGVQRVPEPAPFFDPHTILLPSF